MVRSCCGQRLHRDIDPFFRSGKVHPPQRGAGMVVARVRRRGGGGGGATRVAVRLEVDVEPEVVRGG